jgi:hypothetical protein
MLIWTNEYSFYIAEMYQVVVCMLQEIKDSAEQHTLVAESENLRYHMRTLQNLEHVYQM